ncbi:MAG: lytic transglycosylase domain-containing protein [Anaerolinea sp.]|nr:lytic transglycosylase domain-containing protein [Anaerolinea sp.]
MLHASAPTRWKRALRALAIAFFAVITGIGLYVFSQRIASASSRTIAPLFSPEVQFWSAEIVRWAQIYGGGLDPDLVATVMQIESCGHASIASHAGAQGLFQVMPFHFQTGEQMTDPETNAQRGVGYLAQCWELAGQDVGRTLACYNGGPGVLQRPFERWTWETQRYYVYGMTIYADARARLSHSPSLAYWMDAGGARLCALAAQDLALRE